MHRAIASSVHSSARTGIVVLVASIAGCANGPSQQLLSAVTSGVPPSTAPVPSGCKPVGGRPVAENVAIGAAGGAAAGAAIAAANGAGSRGLRNSAIGGGVAGAIAGYAFGNSVAVAEQPDGSVKLDITGVLFDTGRADIKPDFQASLDKVASSLREYCIAATIIGHTDNVGGAQANLALSLRRANAVQDYLLMHAVPAVRLSATGRGETEPVDRANTEAARARNRRVEIVLRAAS